MQPDVLMFRHAVARPIRTSNLGPLIPVSSRTLGGSSPISGSHSWTEKGISERVPFFQDG